jgi:hypothetical protein
MKVDSSISSVDVFTEDMRRPPSEASGWYSRLVITIIIITRRGEPCEIHYSRPWKVLGRVGPKNWNKSCNYCYNTL